MRAWREEAEETKDAKETEETKDAKETRDARDTGDAEDTKEAEDTEETEDAKETWDAEGADCRDSRSAIQPLVFAEPLSPRATVGLFHSQREDFLNRQLIYTAITSAKSKVSLFAKPETLQAAARRDVTRAFANPSHA
jgi:hypothetical protein